MTPVYFRTCSRYNAWQNQNLIQAAARLPAAELTNGRGLFFTSILGTFNHLLVVDRLWYGRFTGKKVSHKLDEILYKKLDDFAEARTEQDEKWNRLCDGLTPDWLQQTFTFKSMIDGQTRTLTNWFGLTQVFNHATHHRGQVTAVMSSLGIDYGITDYPWLPDAEKLIYAEE